LANGPKAIGQERANLLLMADARTPNHYVLVPRVAPADRNGSRVRRFSLARVAVSPRSALGVDRHERLERVAERG
jgi:hypothetical protein